MHKNNTQYTFIPCRYDEESKRFIFGPTFDSKLESNPDLIQPGDGFYNFFLDSDGRMEYARLVKGLNHDHFVPKPSHMSSDPKDIIGYFLEMSDEMMNIIAYYEEEKKATSNKE